MSDFLRRAMTAEDYVDAVRLLPCCVCRAMPVMAHHVIGGSVALRLGARGSRKHSEFLTIPLCHLHHQGAEGVHAVGVLTWEARCGSQEAHVTVTGALLGVDPWAEELRERQMPRRPYRPSSKIVPRGA